MQYTNKRDEAPGWIQKKSALDPCRSAEFPKSGFCGLRGHTEEECRKKISKEGVGSERKIMCSATIVRNMGTYLADVPKRKHCSASKTGILQIRDTTGHRMFQNHGEPKVHAFLRRRSSMERWFPFFALMEIRDFIYSLAEVTVHAGAGSNNAGGSCSGGEPASGCAVGNCMMSRN